jgi:hypothetical protein
MELVYIENQAPFMPKEKWDLLGRVILERITAVLNRLQSSKTRDAKTWITKFENLMRDTERLIKEQQERMSEGGGNAFTKMLNDRIRLCDTKSLNKLHKVEVATRVGEPRVFQMEKPDFPRTGNCFIVCDYELVDVFFTASHSFDLRLDTVSNVEVQVRAKKFSQEPIPLVFTTERGCFASASVITVGIEGKITNEQRKLIRRVLSMREEEEGEEQNAASGNAHRVKRRNEEGAATPRRENEGNNATRDESDDGRLRNAEALRARVSNTGVFSIHTEQLSKRRHH